MISVVPNPEVKVMLGIAYAGLVVIDILTNPIGFVCGVIINVNKLSPQQLDFWL